jgi:polyisoprenyl-teichoic acid--peptidoglycan teichoic acid transferase
MAPRMAVGDKPYRLYKGGRTKGKVPLEKRMRAPAGPAAPGGPKPARRRRWGRWIALGVAGLLVLLVVWGVLGYLSFSNGVEKANERLPQNARNRLAPRKGSFLSDPTTLLVIGTDGGSAPGRGDARRSDSLLLIRTDPAKHRLSYLSIPRDLRVEIPGFGSGKINSANQFGGPALTIATVRTLTGLPVQHVVVVDFDGFKDLIDALGGIEITVPKPILSNRFDCPYPPKRCQDWKGWRFGKGRQHMDGRRALVYSRIRTNQLDPSDTDISRTGRQQAVAEAVGDKVAGIGTFFRLPFIGDSLAAPVATDLSAWELAKLGWVRFRADDSRALHCRLGGQPSSIGGASVLLGSEDNVDVISMFLRRSAPLAPRKGFPYAAGCTRR